MPRRSIGFEGELYFNADKPDGTMLKLTDPSKLNALGWKHTVVLEEGRKDLCVVSGKQCVVIPLIATKASI